MCVSEPAGSETVGYCGQNQRLRKQLDRVTNKAELEQHLEDAHDGDDATEQPSARHV